MGIRPDKALKQKGPQGFTLNGSICLLQENLAFFRRLPLEVNDIFGFAALHLLEVYALVVLEVYYPTFGQQSVQRAIASRFGRYYYSIWYVHQALVLNSATSGEFATICLLVYTF